MKLQISFDMPDLEKAITTAKLVTDYTHIFEIGTILILKYGTRAIEEFRTNFPEKPLLADIKIVDRGNLNAQIFAQAGATWITVMAGTSNNVIHSTCNAAHALGMQTMLDLLDSCSLGQSALEAKNLGVNALLFHQPSDDPESLTFLDQWDMVKGNTTLPIFISAKIRRENIEQIIMLKPSGIVVGKSITEAENPQQEAQYIYSLCTQNT